MLRTSSVITPSSVSALRRSGRRRRLLESELFFENGFVSDGV